MKNGAQSRQREKIGDVGHCNILDRDDADGESTSLPSLHEQSLVAFEAQVHLGSCSEYLPLGRHFQRILTGHI